MHNCNPVTHGQCLLLIMGYIDKCNIYDVVEPDKLFVANNNKNLNVNNCKFTNINCDLSLAFNTFNSKFYNSKLKYVSDFILNGLELSDSIMSCANAYENNKLMVVDNLIINNTNFSLLNMGGDVSDILSLNQEIPIHNDAYITITIDATELNIEINELITQLEKLEKVTSVNLLAYEG